MDSGEEMAEEGTKETGMVEVMLFNMVKGLEEEEMRQVQV